MNEVIKACIYCKESDAANFKGVEHVIPQAFGTFGSGTPTLNCVCDTCNAYFGQNHDLHLARETIEGITRYKRGLLSSEARPQRHLHITLEKGPETGHFGGMKVAIDGTTNELMPMKAQFHILNLQTGRDEVYFERELNGLQLPEQTYGRPGRQHEKGTWKCKVLAPSKDEYDEMVRTLQKNNIAFEPGEPFDVVEPGAPDKDGKFTLPVLIEGEIVPLHRQAHAKVFLNFIANYFGPEEALKPDWEPLRRYARFNEGEIKYRVVDAALLPRNLEQALLPLIGDSVIVEIRNLGTTLIGTLDFFGAHTYQYHLCANKSVEQEFAVMFTDGREPVIFPL